ncbi:hypothetical protein SH2C18_45540 [Clostridium sediminicola]|uniref:DUF5050 domain-containing protein n=1 Tax=Clostridium sediminicola TaxID=3114879 RepID=UPI0031F253D4
MFNKKFILFFLSILIVASSSNIPKVNAVGINGWNQSGQIWQYFKNGTMQKNAWVQDSIKQWYYLDEKGTMKTNGWLQDSTNRWFYLDSNGVMKSNSWIESSSKQWYYLGSNGAMITNGWAQDSAHQWYYLGIHGTIKKGWVEYLGKWYYLNSHGIMLCNKWVDFKGRSYYLNTNGDMAVNTTTPDGYRVGPDGAWDGNPAKKVDNVPTLQGPWPEAITGSNSLNNNSNGNFFTKVGDWIYYNDAAEKALYKIRTNGNDKTKLIDASIRSMAIKDDYIYFVDDNFDKDNVFRIKKDGTSYNKFSTKITTINSCDNINIYNNYIYFKNHFSVQKLSSDKKEGYNLIVQPSLPRHIYIWNNMMYYPNARDNDYIYVMNLDTEDKYKINETSSYCLNKYNNYIYFSNREDNNSIYRTMIGGKTEKICDDTTYTFNISGEWIYYNNVSDERKLYRVRVDGTNKQKLSDDSAFGISIVGNWIYYYTSGTREVYVLKNDGSRKYKLSTVIGKPNDQPPGKGNIQ